MRSLVCVCREQCCHVRAFLRLCFVQIAECCTNWNYLLLLCKYNRTHVLAGTTRFGLVLCMLIAADRGDTHITNTHTHRRAPEIAPAGNAAIICFCCCCCRRPSVVTNAVITSLHLCVCCSVCVCLCAMLLVVISGYLIPKCIYNNIIARASFICTQQRQEPHTETQTHTHKERHATIQAHRNTHMHTYRLTRNVCMHIIIDTFSPMPMGRQLWLWLRLPLLLLLLLLRDTEQGHIDCAVINTHSQTHTHTQSQTCTSCDAG